MEREQTAFEAEGGSLPSPPAASDVAQNHPLHRNIAKIIQAAVGAEAELVRDPACNGKQHLPLFIGSRSRQTRMCCADMLVLQGREVRVIIEIEESHFLPTTICGKFFQAVLADRFIHQTHGDSSIPYAQRVLFIHVIDSSKFPNEGSRKKEQGKLIECEIRSMLPLKRITDYSLFFVNGAGDQDGMSPVAKVVRSALEKQTIQP